MRDYSLLHEHINYFTKLCGKSDAECGLRVSIARSLGCINLLLEADSCYPKILLRSIWMMFMLYARNFQHSIRRLKLNSLMLCKAVRESQFTERRTVRTTRFF